MEFGTYTNLTLTLTVTLFGIYWLFRPLNRVPYRYRAYCYWWCSWLSWVLAWLLILLQSKFSLRFQIPILIFDNLNSVFLIAVYFILTRGQDLNPSKARLQTILIALSLAIAFGSFYLLFQQNMMFAYEIHRTCSLCISVFTPILVGWAFNLRFKTSAVLMVGCLYGFIQPIVYATELSALGQGVFNQPLDLDKCYQLFEQVHCNQINNIVMLNKKLESIRPIVAMTVGLLKVVWAIICTRILSGAYASHENLIVVEKTKPFRLMDKWWPSVRLHATILIASYIVLLILLVLLYLDQVKNFITAVSVITGVYAIWQMIWGVWKVTNKP